MHAFRSVRISGACISGVGASLLLAMTLLACSKSSPSTEQAARALGGMPSDQDSVPANRKRADEGQMGKPQFGVQAPASSAAAVPNAAPVVMAPMDKNNRVALNQPSMAADSLSGAGGGTAGGARGDGWAAANAEPVRKLDPNARYATTYRPGGAAVSAFDAAVARGDLPAQYKDLVGDLGGVYATSIEAPKGAALATEALLERSKIAPGGGQVNLRVALRSSDESPGRAPLSVHLVLDVSGSMQGAAIDNAKEAAKTLVDKLEPGDDFSLTTFSSDANVIVKDELVGPNRAAIRKTIEGVNAVGGTNISSGLDAGYTQARSAKFHDDAVKVVLLLSDGHANGGDVSPAGLRDRSAKALGDGIQTSTFGLGASFDAQVMGGLADEGAGGYYYLADSTQIASALQKELNARLMPIAQAVEMRVRLNPDIAPIRVYGSHALDGEEERRVRAQEVSVDKNVANHDKIVRDRQQDAAGGMRFFIPAFAKGDKHATLVTLALPPGVGDKALGSVEVRFKDRLTKKNVTIEIPLKVSYAKSDAESAQSVNKSVAATVQAYAAGDTVLRAAQRVDSGDRAGAARMLHERAELLQSAAASLGEPRLLDEAKRLARLEGATQGNGAVNDALPLAVLLRGSGYGYLQ